MQNHGTFTLKQGTARNSGKPYTALKLTVGKWSTLHFPSQFERDYLIEYLKDNVGTITLVPSTESILLTAGDYEYEYKLESKLEYRYISQFLSSSEPARSTGGEVDATLDLENEDELNENPFEEK